MKKVYARQIPYEQQESPLMMHGEYPEDIIMDGNRSYNSRKTKEYECILSYIDGAASDIEDITHNKVNWCNNITEYFHDIFPPTHKAKYNSCEIHQWKEIAKEYQKGTKRDEDIAICRALTLMTGKPYDYTTIKGCSQGDWQTIYYPTDDYDNEFIRCFETEYFNTGTEWIIHDEDFEPKSADDILGYSMYCYTYKPKQEIAEYCGVTVDEVVLYEFESYRKTPTYKLA